MRGRERETGERDKPMDRERESSKGEKTNLRRREREHEGRREREESGAKGCHGDRVSDQDKQCCRTSPADTPQ